MFAAQVPAVVWNAAGVDPRSVDAVEIAAFDDGTGAASGRVELVTATMRPSAQIRIVRKSFTRLGEGRHAAAARRPDHWAYWRRELTAYRSGIVPASSAGLRAPAVIGIVDDVVYLEWVGDRQPDPTAAAQALGRWHHSDHTVEDAEQYPWLARDQLKQRLAVTDLDWSLVDLDPGLERIWDDRHEYFEALDALPLTIAHGDFGIGNLRAFGGEVVAIDWATLGVSPVGFDLAHLALSVLDEALLLSYLDALGDRYDAAAVRLGYRASVSLIGASRAHWMASRSIPLPRGYSDFVGAHALTSR